MSRINRTHFYLASLFFYGLVALTAVLIPSSMQTPGIPTLELKMTLVIFACLLVIAATINWRLGMRRIKLTQQQNSIR